jgi:hypothetical protein
MASWPPKEQTDLAGVTGGLLPMDQCLGLELEVLITFGSVVGLGLGCSNGAASWVQGRMVSPGVGYGGQLFRTSVEGE